MTSEENTAHHKDPSHTHARAQTRAHGHPKAHFAFVSGEEGVEAGDVLGVDLGGGVAHLAHLLLVGPVPARRVTLRRRQPVVERRDSRPQRPHITAVVIVIKNRGKGVCV